MRKPVIRALEPDEYPLLKDFLYYAIFVREGEQPPPQEIVRRPELAVYWRRFGKKRGDHALAAVEDGQLVGAVWTRIIPGYGHVDDDTPEFALSVLPGYRARGVGTRLMREMLALLGRAGYAKASLAVQKDNYALRHYEKVGFVVTGETEQEYVMEYRF